MTDSEIIEKILDGYWLRTFMVPDPAIYRTQPRGAGVRSPSVIGISRARQARIPNL
jgi:hypothetical protein